VIKDGQIRQIACKLVARPQFGHFPKYLTEKSPNF
jgi:hypothetical protein